MKAYETYKNSGYDWYGEVPINWQVKDLKFVMKFHTGGTPSTKERKFYEGDLTWVSIGDMEGKFVEQSQSTLNKDGVKSANIPLTPKGSLMYSFKLSVGQVAFTNKDLYTNEAIASFLPTKGLDLDFWYYALPFSVIHNANENIYGAKLLNQELIKNAALIVPPLHEQRQIAAYLDYKTNQIDRFIANRKKQIELLEEQAKKVMEDLLLLGIREQELRSIDFPYLDKIPSSWEFMKLNHLANITRLAGYEYTSLWKTDDNGEIIALRGQNVGFNCLLDIENADRISNKLSIRLNRSRLYSNDIVFPCVGTVGKAVLIEEDNRYHINQNIAKITPSDKINPWYLTYILNSYFCYHQIIHFNTSDAQPNVLVRDLRRFMIPVPSMNEQDEIVQEINEQRAKHSELISKYKKQIALMQEYKTSLISKAVTGKIDVREWKRSEPLMEND